MEGARLTQPATFDVYAPEIFNHISEIYLEATDFYLLAAPMDLGPATLPKLQSVTVQWPEASTFDNNTQSLQRQSSALINDHIQSLIAKVDIQHTDPWLRSVLYDQTNRIVVHHKLSVHIWPNASEKIKDERKREYFPLQYYLVRRLRI